MGTAKKVGSNRKDWAICLSVYAIAFVLMVISMFFDIGINSYTISFILASAIAAGIMALAYISVRNKCAKTYLITGGFLLMLSEMCGLLLKLNIHQDIFTSVLMFPIVIGGVIGIFMLMHAFEVMAR